MVLWLLRQTRSRASWMFLCTTVHCPGTTNSPGLWTLSLYRYGSQSLAPQTASTASYSHCCTPHHKQRTTSSWCPSRSWWSSPQPTAITQAEKKKLRISRHSVALFVYRSNVELNSSALSAVPGGASNWNRHVISQRMYVGFLQTLVTVRPILNLWDQRFSERLIGTRLLEFTQ